MLKTLILSICILLTATSSHATPITFSDGNFNNADWDLVVTTVGGGGSVNANQESSGGNPGEFRRIVNNLQGSPGIWVMHRRIDAIYNPQTSGAIQSIDYSEDSIMLAGFGGGEATGPALLQNGIVYYLNPVILANQSVWTHQSLNSLDENDFHSINSNGSFTIATPDFSSSGSPITFGFFRANSGTSYTIDAGIDNWAITINIADNKTSTSIPLTTTTTTVPATISNTRPIPDTGQTKCYNNSQETPCPQPGDAFYGQDANYNINPPSYTKLDSNGNELSDSASSWVMVRDNVTGLLWQNGAATSANTWQLANTYCENLTLGGYSDWRLPTIKELLSIARFNDTLPSVNNNYFPYITGTPGTFYWSSTQDVTNPSIAWHITFFGGSVHNNRIPVYVIAVRSSQTTQNLIENHDGTVTDMSTGLMWQQAGPTALTWQNALSYCENLTLAGHDDWRLPNLHELQSLVNYGRVSPAIDTAYFPDTISNQYWSSSAHFWYSNTTAWFVDFTNGDVYDTVKTVLCNVRAVRGPITSPTAITINSFTASPKSGEVIIEWSTASEIDNAGYSIYRATSEDEEYIKINASLIPAKGSPTQGAVYEFIDFNVQNRKTYYYKLEDIDLNGTSTIHGPVSAMPRWIYGAEK